MPERLPYHCSIVVSYLKSERQMIKISSCIMTGAIFGNISCDLLSNELISIKENAMSSLIYLLKSSSFEVCSKAADALSLF